MDIVKYASSTASEKQNLEHSPTLKEPSENRRC